VEPLSAYTEPIVDVTDIDIEQADRARAEAAIALASRWLQASQSRPAEQRRRRRLSRVVTNDKAIELSVRLADSVLRVAHPRRAALLFQSLLSRTGIPSSMTAIDRLGLRVAERVAPLLPRIVMPLVRRRVRSESAGVILPAETAPLSKHLAMRAQGGFHVNVNVLGEAILGEGEATRRLAAVSAVLARPDVQYVSVKVSAVTTQLDAMAFDDSVARILARLRPLFAAAASATPAKFINLDMEEYRDLELTLAAFMQILDEPACEHLEAGIVLQAYLPDSHAAFDRLAAWSRQRFARTGAGIKIRIVKGANLAMEQVEAELHGWQAAPYDNKPDVDASFKRMIDRAFHVDSMQSVRIGVASHNLFDVAWALLLAKERGVLHRVEFEMLEGMAPGEAEQLRGEVGGVRLYTPITRKEERTSAIAYLVRRLDENTTKGNFLREAFAIEPGSPAFFDQADRFRTAVHARHSVSTTPRRRSLSVNARAGFENEPDSDLVLPQVRKQVTEAVARWHKTACHDVPVVINGVRHDGASREWFDPSDPARMRFRYAVATTHLVDEAVQVAHTGLGAWSTTDVHKRGDILRRCADVMAEQRFETLAAMVVDTGKTVAEADPEISEAIDFARYYAHSAERLVHDVTLVTGSPLGVVLVTPPWNFPYAIVAGGVLAALAAGNTVILKPAPEAVRISWLLMQQLWAAGVPHDVLQFVPTDDDEVGQGLVTHPDVAAVILTGAFATAEMFTRWKPDLHLLAETSGKNATVVTAAADIDAAVRDIVKSAFGHAGQKCSAGSLAIVEAPVYDHPSFGQQLQDAVTSLRTGPAWLPTTGVAPVIRAPDGPLLRALTQLDAGESWLVAPKVDAGNPNLWSPGVKLGVQPGSWSHRSEWFGPVLAVMRAPDLATALAWQNGTDYGLTAGIQSLDPAECEQFLETAEAGNLYVNRHITGAVVQRQPFGGWKRSSIGAGAKAGGPHYVSVLQTWTATRDNLVADATKSYRDWWNTHFSQDHDPSALKCERNILRYRPLPRGVLVRISPSTDEAIVTLVREAARITGAQVAFTVSDYTDVAPDAIVESDATLAARLRPEVCDRLRLLTAVEPEVRLAALAAGMQINPTPIAPDGRVELIHWVREQALSITNHRYGRVQTRSIAERSETECRWRTAKPGFSRLEEPTLRSKR
jgi:RHH-type transcriptional regulator, proline utilization regulon repressor / proline dehydrogenase / delta 1-pyrroline-5-carboxylate dehydrogenase